MGISNYDIVQANQFVGGGAGGFMGSPAGSRTNGVGYGNSFYVSYYYGSDGNPGTSWELPFKTLDKAFSVIGREDEASVIARADISTYSRIYIAGDGYAHAQVADNKISWWTDIIGVGGCNCMSGSYGNAIISGTDSYGITGILWGTNLYNLIVRGYTAKEALYGRVIQSNLHNCVFCGGGTSTASNVRLTGDFSDSVWMKQCHLSSDPVSYYGLRIDNQLSSSLIEQNVIEGGNGASALYVGTNGHTVSSICRDNTIGQIHSAPTIGIHDISNGAYMLYCNNYVYGATAMTLTNSATRAFSNTGNTTSKSDYIYDHTAE